MVRTKNSLQFNTAIITYPSDYDGLLTLGLITEKFESIMNNSTKVVIGREDPDDEIQRIHFHVYWDGDKRKDCKTDYFDIPLPEQVIVFIKKDKTRSYVLYNTLASQLGCDNYEEMVTKIEPYIQSLNDEEKENDNKQIESYEILKVAHPNLQLKKEYGDKYLMLRYVCKQKLLKELKKDQTTEEQLFFIESERDMLIRRKYELNEKEMFEEIGVDFETFTELTNLLRLYIKKLKRKEKLKGKKGKSRKEEEDDILEFKMWLRKRVLENNLTKNELLKEIKENEKWWNVYSGAYINYSKLIGDMFKGKSPAKPEKHYEFKFWVPNELFDYLTWLDHWVESWEKGERLEHRPKGLVLIGPSRTGKTTLLSTLGDFSYFKNIWNVDNWEGKAAFTIMDDMDAQDEGKGLSFSWYKPFFGAQDAITVTDKFKPKQDIWNGKPLIWLNNYSIDETFKSATAQDYIRRNMTIVYITRPFTETPTGMDIYRFKEFDPKQTWYYKNRYNTKNNTTTTPLTPIVIVDETEKTIEKCQEQYNDEKNLLERKHRIQLQKESGRPDKRTRLEDE